MPQAMALLQELKIVNLQLKVANNAMVGEINSTFTDFSKRIEKIEEKLFGEAQGPIADIAGESADAMTLPTEQAKKDAELLKKIQEAQEESKPTASSSALGGPVGDPEEEAADEESEDPNIPPTTSMFPRSN